jgi:hypothetical protein
MSKGLPVVFGVVADPKDAKAPPEPSANALEPPVPMGDAKPPPLGVVAAKGFARPWDDVAPLRRDRDEKSLAWVLLSWFVARDKLLVLQK